MRHSLIHLTVYHTQHCSDTDESFLTSRTYGPYLARETQDLLTTCRRVLQHPPAPDSVLNTLIRTKGLLGLHNTTWGPQRLELSVEPAATCTALEFAKPEAYRVDTVYVVRVLRPDFLLDVPPRVAPAALRAMLRAKQAEFGLAPGVGLPVLTVEVRASCVVRETAGRVAMTAAGDWAALAREGRVHRTTFEGAPVWCVCGGLEGGLEVMVSVCPVDMMMRKDFEE